MSLPKMDPKLFNVIAHDFRWGVTWSDRNGDLLPQVEEISKESRYMAPSERFDWFVSENKGVKEFTEMFYTRYQAVNMYSANVEEKRRARVHKELQLTYREKSETDFSAWLANNTTATPEERKNYVAGVKELMKVALAMKHAYQRQIGYGDQLQQEAQNGNLTPDDKELIDRYGQPWCSGDQGPICVALPSLAERDSSVFLNGVTCEEAGDNINSFGNPFTAVTRDAEGLTLVPYAEAFKPEQSEAAVSLRNAAEYFVNIPREAAFTKYLLALADTMEGTKMFPYIESDKMWHEFGQSNSIFLLRAGADETGGDGLGDVCGTKARFHFNLGLVNTDTDALKKMWEPLFQEWENKFAELVGDPGLYVAQKVAMSTPQFYDVIYALGDDVGGPNGTNIGQTLPNWCGENGPEEPCKRRVMIFVNKTVNAYSDMIVNKYLKPLFDESHYPDFDFQEDKVGIESVLAHEIAHNFGPQPGKPKPGTGSTYEAQLGPWKGTMEELKAQTGSMYIGGDILKKARARFKAGEISKEELEKAETHFKKHMLYDLNWAMKMILRATRGGRFEGTTYSKLAAIQIGYLAKEGALQFDAKTKRWKANFENDKFLATVDKLMAETLRLYTKGDLKEVEQFVKYYIEGDGFKLIHSERTVEVASNMPSPLFDYIVTGLE